MRLVILGAGGHGQTVADVARIMKKYSEIIFLDDHYVENECEQLIYGAAHISCILSGKCQKYIKYIDSETEIYPAFGSNTVRVRWQNEILKNGGILPTLLHPSAVVSGGSVISPGTVVLQNAVVNVGCKIEKACIVNVGAVVDHGCHLQEGVYVNSGAVVMAENNVPRFTVVESNTIIPWRKWPIQELY